MATRDDLFIATGGDDVGPNPSGFTARGARLSQGANLQGSWAGAYAESVDAATSRQAQFEGTGVEGVGKNLGVVGRAITTPAGRAIAGVLGQNREHTGVLGITMGDVVGVMGLSSSTLFPGDGTPQALLPVRGEGAGVLGASGSGAGVNGISTSGPGILAESDSGPALDASTARGPAAVLRAGDLFPLLRLTPGPAELPTVGEGGDLVTRTAEDGTCSLWFCTLGATETSAARWQKVLLAPPPGLPATRIAWPTQLVTSSGDLSAQFPPQHVLGRPNGTSFVLPADDGASARFGGFVSEPLRNLNSLLNEDTAVFVFPVTVEDIDRVQVIAFERNGDAPTLSGAWESCRWRFDDGSHAVELLWDGRPGAARDPHVTVAGSMRAAVFVSHFDLVPPDPTSGYRPEEVVSFIGFTLSELDVSHPEFSVTVRGTSATLEGHAATPDIDAIGVLTP